MAKTTKMVEVPVSALVPYGNNAKKHGREQLEKLKASIEEFGFLTPCVIDGNYNLIAGHGRIMAAAEMGIEAVPCVFVEGLTEEQRKAYILADNRLGELGEWDMEIADIELADLAAMDFDVTLTGFEAPSDWFDTRERFDMSREDGNDEYNDFLEKFENKKTTDDCYTPDNIYEVIAGWVADRYNRPRDRFVRPFYPGGDYQKQVYRDQDVIVDNPPFSILAEIVDFYVAANRPFFLFAPGLATLGYTNRDGVAAICEYVPITYENGAKVPTSFLTNLEPDNIAAMADAGLYKLIEEENDKNEAMMSRHLPKYEYPVEVATAAKLGYLSKYGQTLKLLRKDTHFIRALDAQKETGSGIFGAALLLSEKAAAEKAAAEKAAAEKAAAEKAAAEKAAAEKAAATVWQLSDREKEIVKSLGGES